MGYEQPNPHIDGWMGDGALQWLNEKAREMQSVVEIGCWKGRSTHALLSGCLGPVFAVDHFKGSPNELNGAHHEAVEHDIFPFFWQNCGQFPHLVVMRMPSEQAYLYFADQSIDMVFIDATHTYEAFMKDVLHWKPKCKKLLAGHDVSMGEIQGVLRDLRLKWEVIPDGIWSINVS